MSKYLQQSSTMFGSIKNAVLGNPVTREFSIGDQIASFGPGLLWKVYGGKKKSTGQDVSVFILEKIALDRFDRRNREVILERMRHGPQQLTKLRHPRVLTVQHPLEESRDSLAFATEPVLSSLSNVLGRLENFPNGTSSKLKDFELYAVEKVYGLLQIAEGLAFLHDDANLIEGNITTDNIIITESGQWKLAGFHFALPKMSQLTSEYSTHLPAIGRPNLNCAAPEFVLQQPSDIPINLSCADMFSFGCLVCALYNNMKTPFDAGDDPAQYKKCLEQLSRLGSDKLRNVPNNMRNHIVLLLNVAMETRPDARSTLSHPFFDDVAAMTLKYLDSLVQRDDVTKSQFFKNLHHVLDKLPLRVLHQRILPPLFSEIPNHMMIPFILPNILLVAKKSTNEQYMQIIFPDLKRIFQVNKPVQVLLILMQHMELLLMMTLKEDVRNYVLPLVFKALESPSPQIQELVLTVIPDFVHLIDYSSLKNSIVPRMKVLVTKTTSLSVRVNALVCLGKIIGSMDKFLLVDEVFPMFAQIPSREPAVLMAMLGVYKQTLADKKVNLEKDYLATKVLPFLLPMAIEPSLNIQQFNNYMSVIREMFDRVEQEHRTKLEQLNKLQQEQRSSFDFVKSADKNVQMASVLDKVDALVVGKPAIETNSEFEKVLGIASSVPATTASLMSMKPLSSTGKTLNTSSFDPVSSSVNQSQAVSLNMNQSQFSTLNINQSQSSSLNQLQSAMKANVKTDPSIMQYTHKVPYHATQPSVKQQPIDYSSLDSVMSPEMSAFKSRQTSVPLATIQQSKGSNQSAYETKSYPKMHSQPNNPMMHCQSSNPIMQNQPNNPMMHSQPSNPMMHSQPSNPMMHSQPSNPMMKNQPFNSMMHSQPSNPMIHSQPSNPMMKNQPFNSMMHSQSINPMMQSQNQSVTIFQTQTQQMHVTQSMLAPQYPMQSGSSDNSDLLL